MLHGHLIIATANLYSHSVIFEPSVRLRLTGELADSSRQLKVGGITAALMARLKHSGPETRILLLVGASLFWPSR